MRWFRMYADAIDNSTLRLLAYQDRWHYVSLLCLKAQGVIDGSEDSKLKHRRVAIKMGLQSAELDEVLRRLSEVGLIDSAMQPLGWADRQYESDASGPARTRKWRARNRTKTVQARRDVTVTSQKRHCDNSVTPPDPDPDTDTESKIT